MSEIRSDSFTSHPPPPKKTSCTSVELNTPSHTDIPTKDLMAQVDIFNGHVPAGLEDIGGVSARMEA
jgi:hypothetical protein